MKRIGILALFLSACLATAAWAQQSSRTSRNGKQAFPHHRQMNLLPKSPKVAGNFSIAAQQSSHDNSVWELGTYTGGTWLSMGDINDFGIAVAQGDLPDGSTHSLAVSLYGRNAGEWMDLGMLGGTASGWEEGLITISDTGLVVGHSASSDQNRPHAFVWTELSRMVDIGTLADVGYAQYNSSYASGVNRLGTLIVGWSGIGDSCINCTPTLPVVWTPSSMWKNGEFVTSWNIHRLDTAGFDQMTRWFAWAVNDFGQIVGEGNADDGSFVGALWTPLPNGKWKLTTLPTIPAYPVSEPFNINDRGEISGDLEPADFSIWIPAYWKPLDRGRRRYSPPVVVPTPDGFNNCYTDGINELGDLTGECWDNEYTQDRPMRWTTKNPNFFEILSFPGDWVGSFRINNDRIAIVTYGGGEKCSADSYISCGGAMRLH